MIFLKFFLLMIFEVLFLGVAACQALMTICITTEGKLKAAGNGAVENIVALIDEALEVSTDEELDKADAPTEILNDSLQTVKNLRFFETFFLKIF